MEHMKISEMYQPNDHDKPRIKGVVEIYNKDGELLLTDENMIMKTGREKIFSILTSGRNGGFIQSLVPYISINSEPAKSDDEWNNSTYYKYPDTLEAETNYTISDLSVTYALGLAIGGGEIPTDENETPLDALTEINMLKGLEVDGSVVSTYKLSSIGLCFNDNGATKLFSRYVFPTHIITGNRFLTIRYTIYF